MTEPCQRFPTSAQKINKKKHLIEMDFDEPIRKKGSILNFQTKKLVQIQDEHIVNIKNLLYLAYNHEKIKSFFRLIHQDRLTIMKSLIRSGKALTESFIE